MVHSRFNLPDWTAQPAPGLEQASEQASEQTSVQPSPPAQSSARATLGQPVQSSLGQGFERGSLASRSAASPQKAAPSDRSLDTAISAWPISRVSGIERRGSNAADRLTGTEESDILIGNGADDRIVGGNGNDQITGGMGRDRITGGAGYDRFFYHHSREGGDRIVDFSVLSDWFVISASGFKGLRAGAMLARDQFCQAETALDRRDRFIYNPRTGTLSFDADGSGWEKSVELARLPRALTLTYAQFHIIT